MNTDSCTVAVNKRVVSVDALRGFDMFFLIGGHVMLSSLTRFCGNAAIRNGLEKQLAHVKWAGFSAWDLVMPLFLFIVGVAMPFSFNKRVGGGQSKKQIYLHVIKRVIILWIFGMIVEGRLLEYNLSSLHTYCNTLQAIAAGYLISSVIILTLNIRWQMITTAAMLLVFWVLMMLVPTPGHEAGMLTEEGNFAFYIDNLILGQFHDGTSYTWILSSLTFGGTVMLGVMAGHLLRLAKSQKTKVIRLLVLGVGCVVAGWLWGLVFTINKHLWTSSMVLFAGGWSYLLLGIFYLVIAVLSEFIKVI